VKARRVRIEEEAPLIGVPVSRHVEEFLIPARHDEDGVQISSAIGFDGKEYPDPVPMAPPVGYVPPPDVYAMVRSIVADERHRQAQEAEGFETFEEADDFVCDDDEFFDKQTEYEKVFEPPAPTVGPSAAAGATAAPSALAPGAALSPSSSDASHVHGSSGRTDPVSDASGSSDKNTPAGTTPTGQPGS
jgi:hypothetical protein